MYFLTPSFSLLRLQQGTGVLIHARLGAAEDGDVDFSCDLPLPLTAPAPLPGQPDVAILPAAHPGTVHITRGGKDLWADRQSPMAIFRDHDLGRFAFLPIDDTALADLRALLRHRWVRGWDANGPEITLVPTPPFTLDLGIAALDLRDRLPQSRPEGGGYVLATSVGEFTITQAGPARTEILLHKRDDHWVPPRVRDVQEWRLLPQAWLELEGEEEYPSLPITVCDADRDWMHRQPWGNRSQTLFRHRCHPVVAHETGKCVLLSRATEGIIVDEHGVCSEDGYLVTFGHRGVKPVTAPPETMRLDHGRLFIERSALDTAPVLDGHTIVFNMPHLSNYTHWLIDNLLALLVLLDFAPEGARILMPGTLRTLRQAKRRVVDHYDAFRALGFAGLPTIEIEAPICRLEHAYWLGFTDIADLPGDYARALRARTAALRPPPARRDLRLYIARRETRRVANPEALMLMLDRQGFTTHYLEDYSVDQQIDLFSQAEWVIAPHGAELGNLLFCRPGTKLLELAPDCDYKPYFSYMCNKLGLTHGVLPCRTTDGTFLGDIILDMHKFAALFRMLKNRL